MADITNPEVLKFVNEFVRPFSEQLEKVDVLSGAYLDRWFAQLSPLVSGGAAEDEIADGREAEGVSRLTLGDVQNTMALVQTLVTAFDQTGRRDVIRKPTVRPLRLS